MITKLFIPISGEYIEMPEEQVDSTREILTEQGVPSWKVTINQ